MENKRSIKVARRYLSKKKQAYVYKWDQFDLTDLVTGGYDVNQLDDNKLNRALWQECVAEMKNMMVFSDFSKSEWKTKLDLLLKRAGMFDSERREKLAEESANNFLLYLRENGWDVDLDN